MRKLKESYNIRMKSYSKFLMHILLSLIFCLTTNLSSNLVYAQTDTTLDAQKADCLKNTASEWSAATNKCVGKVEDRKTRHDVVDCNKIENLEERKSCQMNLAVQKTGVTGNVEEAASKVSSLQSKSTIINTANTIVAAINFFVKGQTKNSCMSKQIFGITSLTGFLTDIYLKIKTKEKVQDFQNKFQMDLKDNPYNAQVKALQYLKEEQELVKEIASLEKKRQMLLMLGYGAAAISAGYETFGNQSCYRQEETKQEEKKQEETKQEEKKQEETKQEEKKQEEKKQDEKKQDETKQEEKKQEVKKPVDSKPLSVEPAQPKTTQTLVSEQRGNYKYNTIQETTVGPDGTSSTPKVIAVVHNGEVYPEGQFKQNSSGAFVATGKPTGGTYDYNSGSWSKGPTTTIGIRTNYGGSNSTSITNLSFGTNKVKTGK